MSSSKNSVREKVKLAIIGTGGMANFHAQKFNAIRGVEMVAACDVDLARVEGFCAKHEIPAAFTKVGAMLKQTKVDAVSIVTPDAFHAPLSIQCLKAGKHVLCEKPLALSHADTRRMVAAAKRAGKVAMVNFSYRDWSAIQAVAQAVARGEIGEVRHVEASYLQAWLVSKAWGDWRTTPGWLWRLSTRHGSAGVLGDVGVHIIDFVTYPVGPIRSVYCRLKSFDKAPGGRIGEYVLDANDSATLNVEFANGALGVMHTTRWCGGHNNRLFLKIAGTRGTIEIDSDRATDHYRVCRGADLNKAVWKEIRAKPAPSVYERFITAIRLGGEGEPDFARGSEVQKVLDACFASAANNAPVLVGK